jgi:hypothetical protein
MNHRSSLAGQIGRYFLIFFISFPFCRCLQGAGTSLYRCDTGGVIEFRQTACEQGDESVTTIHDSSNGMTPSEPGLRLKKPSEKTDTVAPVRIPSEVEERCWRARMRLERVERRLRSGYRASQYRWLHDRQDAYESYIRRFCR